MDVSKGDKYDDTKGLANTQLAERMRADIENLRSDGTLPEHIKIAVRASRGNSIEILVAGLRDAEIWADDTDRRRGNFTEQARRIHDALSAVHNAYNASYTYVGQDYPNCRFYGGVKLLTEADQEFAERERALAADRRAKASASSKAAAETTLVATVRAGRPITLVITDTATGAECATVTLPAYYHVNMLQVAVVELLLEQEGWAVVRYNRRSTKNPTRSWSVRRAEDAPALKPVVPTASPSPAPAEPEGDPEVALPDPDVAPPDPEAAAPDVEGTTVQAPAASPDPEAGVGQPDAAPVQLGFSFEVTDGPRVPEVAALQPGEGLTRDHLAPGDSARRWVELVEELHAAGYIHERLDDVGAGSIDHERRIIVTDAGEVLERELEHLALLVAEMRAHLAEQPEVEPPVGDQPTGAEDALRRLVLALGALARKRSPLTGTEMAAVRDGLEELRGLRPQAFEAVADVDPGSSSYLRRLLAAADPATVNPRGTPAKDDAALCQADPRCREIELDGTGLSGTTCEYRVNRRRPLIAGRPELGLSSQNELCGELSRWSLPSGATDLHLPDRNVFCTRHAAATLRLMPPVDGQDSPPEDDAPSRPDDVAADVPDDWDGVTILHTAETGTLLLGTSKGDGSYDALRAAGQRWRGLRDGEYAGALYVPQTRDRPAKRGLIRTAKEVLAAAGFKVRVSIDDTPRSQDEVRAARRGRLAARADRLHERAGRHRAASDRAFERADDIASAIPMGQPILVGHHSERHARAHQRRIEQGMRRGLAESRHADRLEEAAAASEASLARMDRPLLIARRIARTEAELRKIERTRAGYTRRFRNNAGEVVHVDKHPAASGEYLEQLEGQTAHLTLQLEADKTALEEHVAAGSWRIVQASDLRPGYQVLAPGGWSIVAKVNKTTVEVHDAHVGTLKYGLHEIGDFRAQ